MPKRNNASTSVSTTPTNTSAKKAKSASAKKAGEKTSNEVLPLEQWHVVLTGDFVVKPKAALEKALKDQGVAVTGSISGKTTHLLLGNRSSVNEWGKKSGVGSSKHTQAMEKGLTILTENEVWSILTGTLSAGEISEQKQAAKLKATKSSSLADKVAFCVQEACSGGGKISLPKLKKELESRFDMTFDNTRSKNSLQKVLTGLVEEGKLVKEGASYKLPEIVDQPPPDVEWTAQDDDDVLEERIHKLCPEVGRWRGLRVLSTKAATGRAECKACGQKIEKGEGSQQIQVMDDSLFQMCVWPEDHHEGVYRGYIESCYPGHEVISRRKFFLHVGCKDDADEQFAAQFQEDWSEVRPHEIEARRS